MKTQTTKNIEYLLFKKTNILGTYGCREVKIGGVFTKQYITPIEEYVDYMTITSKGKITCYEIKVSKEDLYSSSALSFHGHSNFIVMPEELYNEVKDDGEFLRKLKNNFIGVLAVDDKGELVRKKTCRHVDLAIGKTTILLESFAKSTARDAAKLYQLEKSNERRLSSKQIDDLLNEIVTEDFVKNAIEEFGKGEDE